MYVFFTYSQLVIHTMNIYLHRTFLKRCAYNGQQCCNDDTIILTEKVFSLVMNNYAPNFFDGFDTAQMVIDELKNINKGMHVNQTLTYTCLFVMHIIIYIYIYIYIYICIYFN